MKVAPNLNFTVIEPTKKSLNDFVQMVKNIYQNFTQAFNGQIGFGDGTNIDNINGSWINVVTPVAPNTDFIVNHNLQRTPSGYWIMQKDRAVDVYTGGVPSTVTQITLRATVASAVIRLFIIGLLLSFASRTEAQNVPMHDIALSSANTAVGIVARPIPSALITVCAGSHAEIPCSPATVIFSTVDGVAQANPFNADFNGNFSFFATPGNQHTVSITGVGITGFNYPYFAPLVTFGALGNATYTSLTSSSANHAASGSIRLANTDNFCIRNSANSGDNCFFGSGPGSGNIGSDFLSTGTFRGIFAPIGVFSSTPTFAATTGAVRFANSDRLVWRNNANTNDLQIFPIGPGIGNVPADVITSSGSVIGLQFESFISNNTNIVSTAGVMRLGNGEAISWRNNANSANVSLNTDNSDNLLWNGTSFAANIFQHNGGGQALSGFFRLNSGDSISWRNNANSGDLALSKNASDQLVYAGSLICTPTQPAGCVTTAVFSSDLTNQSANVGAVTLTTPGANGFYKFSCFIVETVTAGVSATLPTCQVNFTDADSSSALAIFAGFQNSSNFVGSVGGSSGGGTNANYGFYAKSGTPITFSTTGYASNPAATMKFAVHARLEGPF